MLDVRIQEDILNGKLKPGEKLNISALKKRYNVGLAPLRESLSRLVSTGLLVCQQNKGFSVAPVSKQELKDLSDLSEHLEVFALEQAIERGNEAWEEGIISALYHLDKVELCGHKPKYEDWISANTRFHEALVASCSDIVKDFRSYLKLKLDRYARIAFGLAMETFEEYNKEHHAIAKATLAKNKQLATKLLRKHFQMGTGLLMKKFETVDKS